MYKSEQKFSMALVRMLKRHFPIVQRIETGTTGLGVPDIYCRSDTNELWLELKNDPLQSIHQSVYKVPWRAGQQAWHYEYFRTTGHTVITIMAVKDGFVIIPLSERFARNRVPINKACLRAGLTDLWEALKELWL